MKNLLTAVIVMMFGLSSFAQHFDGYVVTNENDTISCKFFVHTNMFNREIFYATSVNEIVKILTEDGQKIKYRPKDIKCFYIPGTTDGNFKFVSFKEDGFKRFYHEVVLDRLSYYRYYRPSVNSFPNDNYREFIYKDQKFMELGFFNTRKNLAELIKDNQVIYDKWMDPKGYYSTRDAFNIINQYNDSYRVE